DPNERKRLQTELRTYQALHATVLREYADAITPRPTILQTPQIVAEAAPIPSSDIPLGKILLFAVLGGAFEGTAVAAQREILDWPIRRAETIEQRLGFRFLGSIAEVPGRKLVPSTQVLPPLVLHDDQDVLRKALARILEADPAKVSYVIG